MACPLCACCTQVCAVLGALVLAKFLLSWFLNGAKALITPKRDLAKQGEWAVVTGATDGIGKAIAKQLAKRGMSVYLLSRSPERLEETAKELKALPKCGQVKTLSVDFSQSPEKIYPQIEAALKDLDVGVLVNNVGVSYPHAMYYNELPAKHVDDMIELNVRSVLRMTHIVYPGMMSRKRGVILSISSGAATLPSDPLYCGYSATKAAAEAMTRSLAPEAATKNVLVQCQCPLLVTSKLSKVRSTGFFTPNPDTFASQAVKSLEAGDALPALLPGGPILGHKIQMGGAHLLPVWAWNKLRFSMVSEVRRKAMKKKEKEAAEKTQ
eukprot:GDKI01049103.1.p1 GENE.GDKI01049103.1~~GDKI01049103.1.p1  ORF type:complete len:324 (-),score=100.47 GDKI01049103.1:113-1084(-)